MSVSYNFYVLITGQPITTDFSDWKLRYNKKIVICWSSSLKAILVSKNQFVSHCFLPSAKKRKELNSS